jgi:hypothetical protein
MTKDRRQSHPQAPAPRPEPLTSYEELPIVTEAARAELLASLEKEKEDLKAGRVKRMSVAEFREEIRSHFERITGYKIL